jgi:hypothetical protein
MLVTRTINKNDVIKGAGWLSKNYIILGEANSTGVPPDQKVNKSLETNLSL